MPKKALLKQLKAARKLNDQQLIENYFKTGQIGDMVTEIVVFSGFEIGSSLSSRVSKHGLHRGEIGLYRSVGDTPDMADGGDDERPGELQYW